ncbi:MAG: hypothetical protein Fur0041_05740 [Bacteroidia bacterium]
MSRYNMKKISALIIPVFLLLFLSSFEYGNKQDGDKAVITFESEVIDFGTIKQGSEAIREFHFTNTGKAPLIISGIKGQCGCTSIPDSWPKTPIPPGGKGSFQVKYDTSIRVGLFEKKITVSSNATVPSIDVRIKGNVVPAG